MLRTLGALRLGNEGLQAKPALLLAYLALEGARPRRYLAELFWPDAADPAHSLRGALRALRRVLPTALRADADGLVAVTLPTDAQAMLRALEQSDTEGALLHYRGPFLEGAPLGGLSPELEEWIYSTREFLARSLRGALLREAEREAAAGRADAAAAGAERAYTLAGAPALEPDELNRVYALFVRGDHPRAADLRREANELGLTLAPVAASAPLVEAPGQAALHNLPARGTTFVGRDAELLRVARLLARPELRLLTLVGPGGVGKTRLALEAALGAAQAGAFPGGVRFAALENVALPERLPAGVAGALGGAAGQADPLRTAAEAVGDGRVLLVLDNFEHLLAGAPFVSALLGRCPHLKVLATSRERLNLDEEWTLPVAGFPVPPDPTGDAAQGDAAQLFVGRAERVATTFTLTPDNLPDVLAVCRLVGGSPLGIELAAAWVRMFSPAEIAAEIGRDLDFLATTNPGTAVRHRSVRAAFDYSWRLLGPKEREALAGLSVFHEGFGREAAAQVVGITIPVLASLVDKSLLRADGAGRYDRHLLIYGFAAEKLGEAERERLAGLHAAYYLNLAEELDGKLWRTRDVWALRQLEAEHGNLRAALLWALGQNGGAALRLGGALSRFWETRGHLAEGRRWLEAALGAHPDAETALRAKALVALGRLTQLLGETAAAERLFRDGLALWRRAGDAAGTAEALNRLGSAALARGDYGPAECAFEEGLELTRTLGTEGDATLLLNNLGELARARGDFRAARAFYEETLRQPHAQPNLRLRAIVLGNLGFVAGHLGDAAGAAAFFGESLALKVRVRDDIGASYCFAGLAGVACAAGSFRRAARLLGVVDALLGRNRHRLDRVDQNDVARTLEAVRARLEPTVFRAEHDRGRALSFEEAVAYALNRPAPAYDDRPESGTPGTDRVAN